MARANVRRIGTAVTHLGYDLRNPSWGVPFFVLPIVTVQLDKLRKISRSAEHIFHAAFVKMKAISGQLKAAFRKMLLNACQKAVR